MNRLTDKRMRGKGFISVDPKEYKAFVRNEKPTEKQIYQRLLEIEDILGEDYDLDRLRVMMNQHISLREEVHERFKLTGDIPLDRLRELVQAEREKRCFVSDVKLGDEVFYIPRFNGKAYCGIQTGHVQAISFTKAGKRLKIREHHAHNQDFMLGKSVFKYLTDAQEKSKEEK